MQGFDALLSSRKVCLVESRLVIFLLRMENGFQSQKACFFLPWFDTFSHVPGRLGQDVSLLHEFVSDLSGLIGFGGPDHSELLGQSWTSATVVLSVPSLLSSPIGPWMDLDLTDLLTLPRTVHDPLMPWAGQWGHCLMCSYAWLLALLPLETSPTSCFSPTEFLCPYYLSVPQSFFFLFSF